MKMYLVKVCSGGGYVAEWGEYPLEANGIEIQEAYGGETAGNVWAKTISPFTSDVSYREVRWKVEVIESREMGVARVLDYLITGFPLGGLLKKEAVFRMQDRWACPRKFSTADLFRKYVPCLKKIDT
ncbi:hypothetical protein ACX3YG_05775 [Pseudomonas wadenswilerensis]